MSSKLQITPAECRLAPLSATKWRKTRGDHTFETRSLRLSVCGIDWPLKPRCRNLCSPASSKMRLSDLTRLPLW